jgi:hypothetical protein
MLFGLISRTLPLLHGLLALFIPVFRRTAHQYRDGRVPWNFSISLSVNSASGTASIAPIPPSGSPRRAGTSREMPLGAIVR